MKITLKHFILWYAVCLGAIIFATIVCRKIIDIPQISQSISCNEKEFDPQFIKGYEDGYHAALKATNDDTIIPSSDSMPDIYQTGFDQGKIKGISDLKEIRASLHAQK
jgi:hypothetical protein